MASSAQARTPVHLWIVGVLALLWNAVGCYDYLMTRMRNTDYLKSMMPDVDPQAMLAYVDGFPIWASIGWGLGVWLGLAGSVLLLMRNRHAVLALGLSLLGAVLGLGYQLAPADAGSDGLHGDRDADRHHSDRARPVPLRAGDGEAGRAPLTLRRRRARHKWRGDSAARE